MLLLLIQNEKAGGAGSKHRTAGAHHYPGVSAFHPLPLVVPLGGGQAAVQHRHLSSKIGCKDSQQLGRQGNFRNQEHGAFPGGQTGLNQPDIHAGFSGAGDAVKQGNARLFLRHLGSQAFKTGLLLLVQHQRA